MLDPTARNEGAGNKAPKPLSPRMSALWFGFTGLLLLMAGLAIDSGRLLRNVAATSAGLRRESRERDGLLDQLRTDIYHSGTVVRDYLLEVDDARAQGHKTELERVRARIDDTLGSYAAKVPESERIAFKDLRDYVESYWKSLAPSLQWNAAARRKQGEGFLRDVVIPRRAEIVQLARQVTALNERDLDRGEESLQALQSQFRQRVTVISIIALILGGIPGGDHHPQGAASRKEAEARYQEAEEARRELGKLSESPGDGAGRGAAESLPRAARRNRSGDVGHAGRAGPPRGVAAGQ